MFYDYEERKRREKFRELCFRAAGEYIDEELDRYFIMYINDLITEDDLEKEVSRRLIRH